MARWGPCCPPMAGTARKCWHGSPVQASTWTPSPHSFRTKARRHSSTPGASSWASLPPRARIWPRRAEGRRMRVLVVDVGGTHVKVLATGQQTPREFSSGPELTAARMVDGVKAVTADWTYDAVSIGYPGPVLHGRPVIEPRHLGPGWVGFDYQAAFGCPVKVVNDAAMQALGSYQGGKMLFLGLGTGLGSTLIVDGIV